VRTGLADRTWQRAVSLARAV